MIIHENNTDSFCLTMDFPKITPIQQACSSPNRSALHQTLGTRLGLSILFLDFFITHTKATNVTIVSSVY